MLVCLTRFPLQRVYITLNVVMDIAEIEARLEKLRRLNRERVNRWRARHPERALAQQRKQQARIREALALYNERKREETEDAKVVERIERQPEATVSEEDFVEPTHYAPFPDEELSDEQQAAIAARGSARAGVALRPPAKSAPRSRPVNVAKAWDAPGPRTEHEMRMKEEAERFAARKKEREAAVADRQRRRGGVRTALDS